ncbi:hypothetical protein Mal4_05390 [Maioricimonas rarisocia]|uniref:DUF2304 domain-containing protein n=1 Tax=Maioricimonas rarisocia TaxID=2528026 RepID=A0A517Z1B1_9PLAN|nr:DUF2304 domain-containing protein [Maioricimonas rarisocia]QDU36255.1 hypothetical protein Mal4_05390 [Maioricimonas rarisocia]
MKAFQWVVVPILLILVLLELLALVRGRERRRFVALRLLVWAGAAVAVGLPDTTSSIARMLGIGRGTDLVVYLFLLAFIATSFFFYSRYTLLQRQITELVRREAIREAEQTQPPALKSGDGNGAGPELS